MSSAPPSHRARPAARRSRGASRPSRGCCSCRPARAPRAAACRGPRRPRRRRERRASPWPASLVAASRRRLLCRGLLPGLVRGRFLSRLHGLQLIVLLEGRALAALQGHVVDLRLPIPERLRLARAPGAADERLEVAIREEVEPLAVRAPRRAAAVEAIRRRRHDARRRDLVEVDPRQQVGPGAA